MDPVTVAGLILTAISDSNNARHDMEGDSVVAQCPAEEGQQETRVIRAPALSLCLDTVERATALIEELVGQSWYQQLDHTDSI